MSENVSRDWKAEFEHLIELNHGFLDDLLSEGLIEYEDHVEDLEAKSTIVVQRERLINLMVNKSPDDISPFLEALRTTNQEHVANFITQKGCKYLIYLFTLFFTLGLVTAKLTGNYKPLSPRS